MSINPNLVTTVQVSELPPNPLSNTSLFPHQVGDILSQSTIQQLVDYVRSQSLSQPYEIKYIRVPNPEYITDNFDMTPGATQGLGKVNGLWNGWAIFNGNNGTDNLDGITLIGFGANYATIGQFTGSATVTLGTNHLPSHNHPITLKGSVNTSGGSGQNTVVNTSNNAPDLVTTTGNTGGGQAHNNMQPSMVVLMIMKLP